MDNRELFGIMNRHVSFSRDKMFEALRCIKYIEKDQIVDVDKFVAENDISNKLSVHFLSILKREGVLYLKYFLVCPRCGKARGGHYESLELLEDNELQKECPHCDYQCGEHELTLKDFKFNFYKK